MKRWKEVLLGVGLGLATAVLVAGVGPWLLASKIAGCAVACIAIRRIMKRMPAKAFTVSYTGAVLLVIFIMRAQLS